MQHLHTSLLFICLLALQDTASAFFRAKPLPPNKHWLKFKHAGGEVAVKLNLERLRVLAERDAEYAQEVFDTINLLPQASNPLLVLKLLESSIFLTEQAIKGIPTEGKELAMQKQELSPSEREALWLVFYKQKEFASLLWGVYDELHNALLNNTELLQLFAIAEANAKAYKSMLEARLSSIDKSFRDNTRMSQLLRRYVPELPRDRVLTKQEFALFEKKIRAKLTELDASLAPQLLITSWMDMETRDWQEVGNTTDAYSKALYYQAVVADMLADGGGEGLKDRAKAYYVASDLVSFFYPQHSRHKYFAD